MINNGHDYARMQNEWWYRIPIKNAPPIIQKKEAKIIAFYSTSKVKAHKCQIRHYGIIKRMTEVSRQELFPEESPYSRKANKRYYKVELEKLEELPQPIVSRRGHRNVLIPTTEQRFFGNATINYLQNFDNWWDANRSFLQYIKQMFPEINRRYPGWVADKVLNIDYDEVLNQEIYYRN